MVVQAELAQLKAMKRGAGARQGPARTTSPISEDLSRLNEEKVLTSAL